MPDGQQITEPQPAAVGHQNPCREKDSPRAARRTPRHLRGYRKQFQDVCMAPRGGVWSGTLDAPQLPHYCTADQSLLGGEPQQGLEHSPVVGDSLRGKTLQGIGQIGVDCVGRKVFCPPSQTAAENLELLTVSGSAADSVDVRLGKCQHVHGVAPLSVVGKIISCPRGTTPPRTPSSIVSGYVSGALAWAASRRWLILRRAWQTALSVARIVHASGLFCVALLLGQLGEFFMEGTSPRRGISQKEVL
jgi:hypothetical protein